MSLLSSIFGSKPSVPTLKPLDLGKEQGKATAANLANLPAAEDLVGKTNKFTQDQITKMLENAIPGFSGITGKAAGNIDSMLRGEIPTDVSDAIVRSDAARNLMSGTSGSGAGRNLVARDLGLTSLDLTQKGLTSAENWIGEMDKIYAPGQMNVTSMFVSPSEQAAFDVNERNTQFETDWMRNQISAMPDPVANNLFNFFSGAALFGAKMGANVGGNIALGGSRGGGGGGGSGASGGELSLGDADTRGADVGGSLDFTGDTGASGVYGQAEGGGC